MERSENQMKYFTEIKIDNKIKKKVLFSLKYYLARTCNTTRFPEIIQLNHYVDKYYANVKDIYKKVVLSPSQVPFPIAYFVNYSLIKKDDSKLFYVDKNGNYNLHPYEFIIPVFVGLFADCGSSRIYTIDLFISSILISGEICMELINSSLLNPIEAICVSVVFVIGLVWDLRRGSIEAVLDDIFSLDETVEMQICLQAINVACCSPDYFTSIYVPKERTSSLVDFMMKSLVSNRKEFASVESLQFPLFTMNAITAVLAGLLCEEISSPVSIIVNEKILKEFIGEMSLIEKNSLIKEIRDQLTQLIVWSQSNFDSIYKVEELRPSEELLKSIVIEIVDNKGTGSSNIEIVGNPRGIPISIMSDRLEKWNSQHLEMYLQSVIGVDGTRITLDRIDGSLTSSLTPLVDALSMVFERPPLD